MELSIFAQMTDKVGPKQWDETYTEEAARSEKKDYSVPNSLGMSTTALYMTDDKRFLPSWVFHAYDESSYSQVWFRIPIAEKW